MGFKTEKEIYFMNEFHEYGDLYIATEDGSWGFKGNAIDFLNHFKVDYDYYYACGQKQMLSSLWKISKRGYQSLETNFGCGIGACMGCSVKTTGKPKRICKDGPIFKAEELLYE
jgi:dihydroorotate dehydrogenase electron transfer subunit